MNETQQFLTSAFNHIMECYTSSDDDQREMMCDQMLYICREMDQIDAEVSSEMEVKFRTMANL